MGVDVGSFAVAGSIVIFILGLEMVLGVEFSKVTPMPNREPSSLLHFR
jgi:multiple antibiotic resistance protein